MAYDNSKELAIGQQLVTLGLLSATDLALALKKRQEMSEQGEKVSLVFLLQEMNLVDDISIEEAKSMMEKSVESTEDFSEILMQAEESSVDSITSKKRIGRTTTMVKKRLRCKTEEDTNRYEMLDKIGAGGMGAVYKAHDAQLDRLVAIKFLKSSDSEKNVQRFLREARAIARLKHPNIITIYDIDEEEEQPFFTMDFIEGDSLKEMLTTRKMDFAEITEVMKKIASAISYAHKQKIIHRDLKPANIMMQDNEPLVMDFGLAKMEDNEQISQEGVVLGTLCYMAPEQADGRLNDIDERSDLYALGVILFEMLTQELPFTGNSFLEILPKVIHMAPPLPSSIRSDVPKNLEQICLKALAKKPEQRYQNAEELMDDLNRAARGEVIAKPSSKMLPAAVAVIIVCLVTAVGLFQMNQNQKSTTDVVDKPVKEPIEDSKGTAKANSEPNTAEETSNPDKSSTDSNPDAEETEKPKVKILEEPQEDPVEEVVIVPGKLFDDDLFRRLDGWEKEGKWAPMEDSNGAVAIGKASLQRKLSGKPAIIQGSIHALGFQSREGGLWLTNGDKSIGIHLRVLSKNTYLVQLGYFVDGKMQPPFIYANTLGSTKGIQYIFLWNSEGLRWRIGDKRGKIDWDKPMSSIHLYNSDKSHIRFGQIYFKERK